MKAAAIEARVRARAERDLVKLRAKEEKRLQKER